MTTIELCADFANSCGEAPLWHPNENCLYWCDVDEGRMFRWRPGGRAEEVYHGPIVGGMTLHEDGRLLLFMQGGAIKLWSPGELETVLEGIPEERDSRFNDVIADPAGRVFCGTMPTGRRPGRLYRLDPDGSLTKVLEDVGMPNGLGFSPDLSRLYLTDSEARSIYQFHFDPQTGLISQRQLLTRLGAEEGKPDGLTVDTQGCLWSARFGGHCLVRYDERGNLLHKLTLPVENITSLTFAGAGSQQVFITSAGGSHRPQAGEKAGALFSAELPATGRAEFRSRRL